MLDQLDFRAGAGWLFFLAVVLLDLTFSLVTGKVGIVRSFGRMHYASRRDTPAGYWLFWLYEAGFALMIAWWAALAMGAETLLPVGAAAAVERALPYAAGLAVAIYIVTVVVLTRRRRARLRAAHPSAVERASGGV